MSRIFKAKYFPNTDVLNVVPKANSSFTWKSICAAKDLVSAEICWRVGNRENIDIWRHKWIPGYDSFRPKTPDLGSEGPLSVSFLIHPNLNDWDLPVLTFLFWQDDVNEILKIPLANWDALDTQVWHYAKHGRYTVSSAYHLAMKLRQKQEENETGASSRPVQRNWNFVWSLKVPNKVRLFLCRVLHNSLPTNSELQRRHLFDENLCGICGQQGETILHLFRDCHFARQYWAISNFPTASIYWDTSDIWDWINGVRVRLDGQEFGLFVLSCWSIWYCRNKLVHDQQLFTPLDTYHYVVQHWNFLKSNMFKPVGRSVTNSETVHGPWKKPPMG